MVLPAIFSANGWAPIHYLVALNYKVSAYRVADIVLGSSSVTFINTSMFIPSLHIHAFGVKIDVKNTDIIGLDFDHIEEEKLRCSIADILDIAFADDGSPHPVCIDIMRTSKDSSYKHSNWHVYIKLSGINNNLVIYDMLRSKKNESLGCCKGFLDAVVKQEYAILRLSEKLNSRMEPESPHVQWYLSFNTNWGVNPSGGRTWSTLSPFLLRPSTALSIDVGTLLQKQTVQSPVATSRLRLRG